jgi:serine/threonine protein kinase/tetratricopeptide (TPR) repeat protein
MVDDGKTLPPDYEPPTVPGVARTPGVAARTSLGAQTPPPLSNDVTLGDALTSPSPVPISDSALKLAQLFPPGTLLAGRYEIVRVLGEGGMGAVYQARDRELERIIALKVIRPELAGNAAILQRFKQELILARHVTHKNVVRIYDLGEADGIKFITMEYVDGEDLRLLLKTREKFPPKEAVQIIEQVCLALEAAHAEDVIHRDLKPQNIMRDRQGRIVVMDFGLARSLEDAGMTQTGALVGTLEYMSPEQALGAELDQRSDLFTVGLIFYELLTGKVPYKADTALASLMKRTQERAVPASQVDNTVPKALSKIVSRCLERDPSMRYQHAMEILKQLQAWDSNPNISPSVLARMATAQPSRTVQISLSVPERRGWLWAAAVALLIVLLFAIPLTRNLVLPKTEKVATSSIGIPDLGKGKYVAILPFRVLGDEKSLRYVADGLEESLSAKLFQLKEVHVASSSAVDKVAAGEQSLGKIARALGVNLILQGTVQGTSDHLRVTLDLEDVANAKRVWGQEFAAVPQDLLALEDQVYGYVADALDLNPTSDEMARIGIHPTENGAAYDLYLQGRNAIHGDRGVQAAENAMRMFDAALSKDRNFALAYTGMADASLLIYKARKEAIWAQKALISAQQAARLNSNLPEVHFALGSVYNATGKTAEAIEELKRALALAPNSDDAYRRLGDVYRASGNRQLAVSAYQNAVTANPYYWYNHNSLGVAYFQFGDTEKALQEYQRVTELAPDHAAGFANMGGAYLRLGKWSEATPPLRRALELQPDSGAYSNLGTANFYLRRYDEAVKMFEKAVEINPKDEALTGNLADAYRWSGRAQQAVSTYEKAIALAYQQLQVNPRAAGTVGDLALYYAKKGDLDNGERYIRQARAMDSSDVQLIYSEAQVYAVAGKQEQALKALREACEKGFSLEEAANDPELSKLKGLPEFAKLSGEFNRRTRRN